MGKIWHCCIGMVLIALWGAGCDFRRVVVNAPISSETLQRLNPGEDLLNDIVQTLGAPDEIDEMTKGMVLRYRYGDSKTMRVNFGWIFRIFLPVVPSMHLGRGEGVTHVLHIAMNGDGTFDHYFVQDPPAPPRFWFWPF
ncbi:MAG: hypothetical protein OEW33_00310 [Nitrospirota bacterium]|nr:hypothetical protein [Nitrospirota bacterium]MDH4359168.1 hypothetical protein [Nitrospirota bacterium]